MAEFKVDNRKMSIAIFNQPLYTCVVLVPYTHLRSHDQVAIFVQLLSAIPRRAVSN